MLRGISASARPAIEMLALATPRAPSAAAGCRWTCRSRSGRRGRRTRRGRCASRRARGRRSRRRRPSSRPGTRRRAPRARRGPLLRARARRRRVCAVAMRRPCIAERPRETRDGCKRFCRRQRHAPACEQVALALGQRDERRARPGRAARGRPRSSGAAAPPAIFGVSVRKSSSTSPAASRWELSVGPALAEHRAHAALLAQAGHQQRQVVADARVLDLLAHSGQLASEPVAITTSLLGVVQDRQVRRAGRAARSRSPRAGRGRAPRLALGPQLVGLRHPAVALRATVPAPTITASTWVRRWWKSRRSSSLERPRVRPSIVALPSSAETMFTPRYGPSGRSQLAQPQAGRELLGRRGAGARGWSCCTPRQSNRCQARP